MEFRTIFDLDYVLNTLAWNESDSTHGKASGWALNYMPYNVLFYDILYLNALNKGQSNLYEEFITKSFFTKLENIYGSKSMSRSIMPLLNLYEDEVGNKHLIYDLNIYINTILSANLLVDVPEEVIDYNENIEEKISVYREIMREERRRLNDVLTKKKQSEYYDKYLKIYNEEFNIHNGEIKNIPITMDNYLESKIAFCTKMCLACRYLGDVFKKEINIDELMRCFDYDKFCLILCYSMLKQSVNIYNKTTSAINYCANYFEAYNKYKENNPKYNPYIVVYNSEKNRHEKVSADELFLKYKKIKDSHPEFYYYNLSQENIDIEELLDYVTNNNEKEVKDLNKKELTSLLRMFLTKQEYETVSNNEITQNIETLTQINKSNIGPQEKNRIQQQIEKMEFLLERKPVKIIKGQGTFSNYYGYIYSNGYIVFDTLDKDFNKSYGNAMFVMPYEKMESFYNVTKRELRSNYKGIITPINHKGNWKERMGQLLDSKDDIDMSDNIIDTIDISKIIDVKQLDELKRKYVDLTKEETEKIEKRKRKIKLLKEIDNELIEDTKPEPALTEKENAELNEEIDELTESQHETFDELYELWKKKHNNKHYKRNPAVAKYTKDRARNEEGDYCCELCGDKNFEQASFDSHHMIPLGEGGIDNIYNTVCLCPNCHRYVHSGKMTYNQKSGLYEVIRKHLEEENPEYLPNFEKMISPIAESEEDYEKHKDEIDYNFSVMWNGETHKSR